jgi:hypothetical protein
LQATEEFLVTREPETVIFATKRDELAGIYQTYLPRSGDHSKHRLPAGRAYSG